LAAVEQELRASQDSNTLGTKSSGEEVGVSFGMSLTFANGCSVTTLCQRHRRTLGQNGILAIVIMVIVNVPSQAVPLSSLKRGEDMIGGDSQLAMLPFPRVGRSVTAAASAAPSGGGVEETPHQRRNIFYGEKRVSGLGGRDVAAFSAESMLPFPRVGRSQLPTAHRNRGAGDELNRMVRSQGSSGAFYPIPRISSFNQLWNAYLRSMVADEQQRQHHQ